MKVKYMKPEHKEYLDDLRESGETNMFGARPYLMKEFDLYKSEASEILKEWMNSFGKEIEYDGEEE